MNKAERLDELIDLLLLELEKNITVDENEKSIDRFKKKTIALFHEGR